MNPNAFGKKFTDRTSNPSITLPKNFISPSSFLKNSLEIFGSERVSPINIFNCNESERTCIPVVTVSRGAEINNNRHDQESNQLRSTKGSVTNIVYQESNHLSSTKGSVVNTVHGAQVGSSVLMNSSWNLNIKTSLDSEQGRENTLDMKLVKRNKLILDFLDECV